MRYRFLAFLTLVVLSLFFYKLNSEIPIVKVSTEPASQVNRVLFGAEAAKEDEDLTVEKMLIYAMEDEYYARARYQLAVNIFGAKRPFINILDAEQTHIDLLTSLFKKYNVEIPTDQMINFVQEPETVNDSLEAGIKGEINNIDMYERFLKQDIPNDVKSAFTFLKNASRNHLQAFEKQIRTSRPESATY